MENKRIYPKWEEEDLADADDLGEEIVCLRADYSSLLARHTALVEAVAWERECDVLWYGEKLYLKSHALYELFSTYEAARAEVDRLLGEQPC